MVTKALVLAAGLGSRLQPLTEHQPKCLVKVSGRAILEHQLISLSQIGITECIIATGYKGSMIQDQFGSKYGSISLKYVDNPIFATTNNIYSLYLLKDHVKDACLLLEGDVLVEDSVLLDLVSNEASNIAVLDHVSAGTDGTIVFADHNRVIEMVLKEHQSHLTNIDSALKTVNIYKFSKNMLLDHLLPLLEEAISEGQINVFYESVLAQLIKTKTLDLVPMIISGKQWVEIDNPEDLAQAENTFAKLH